MADPPAQDPPAQDPPKQDPPAHDAAVQDPPAQSPAVQDPTAQDTPAQDTTALDPPAQGRWRRAPLLLGVASVAAAGFAVWAGVQVHDLRGQQAERNVALTDAAATSQVQRQVASAIDTIFSYNYADTATTRKAAQRLLTGKAIHQYDTLFSLVQQEAPAQHLVLTTKVTNSGVELLIGNRARLLVFADQRDSRAATHQTSQAGAMFAVNVVREDGRWKIDTIDTFSG
jgi:Mce-associated membrane protein